MVKQSLVRKLFRDMLEAKGQFLSIIILSMLGVCVFSGLDAAWRDIELSINKYFKEQRLADFWVNIPFSNGDTESKINHLQGVKDVQSRISMEVPTDLPGNPTLMIHALDGSARINIPVIKSGSTLLENDQWGCLVEEQFAQAHNLLVGDKLTIQVGGQEQAFIIRGLAVSPEYIITSKGLMPDPQSFGFMIANRAAFPQVPINEMLVLLSDTADNQAVKEAIEAAHPSALVRDRTAHLSTEMIRSEVTQFRSLSGVFPVLFFAVSALIVLTTMTRMVENQRTQLGILEALGYYDRQIFKHYLSYGFYPSLIGSCAGLFSGRYALPRFLWNLESAFYKLPPKIKAPISLVSIVVCGMSILLSCLINYLVCRHNLMEVPAALLRPKAPKAGTRILLEHFPAFWGRLKFNTKMIQRNIFRSKSRTIMALLGILSCTALLITALGMRDTFHTLIFTHYGQTLRHDLRVELKKGTGTLALSQHSIPARTVEGVMEMAVSLQGGNGSRTVLLSVLEENQTLIDLGTEVLPGNGVIMTEKLASVMNVQAGDIVTVRVPGDNNSVNIKIGHLAPMGMGQGIYLSSDVWESLGKGSFVPNALLLKEPFENCVDYLDRLVEVDRMDWASSQREKILMGMESVISIIVLMGVFALVLAFVVLYNMGILNFMERTREFATLKVLGYYQAEIRSLIVRENVLISCTGIVLGILPGLWLETLVMRASEPEDMMLTPSISMLSIGLACGVTLAFSLLIQLFLTRKVKSINMVEALKSVE